MSFDSVFAETEAVKQVHREKTAEMNAVLYANPIAMSYSVYTMENKDEQQRIADCQ